MSTLNAYATLSDYKKWIVTRGGSVSQDLLDDEVIEWILKGASAYIDSKTRRNFFPFVETRYYDIPYDRTLWLDGDLLEVISLLNGDGTPIASTEYFLEGKNFTPHWAVKLKQSSSVYWAVDSDGNTERVIGITGIWGYHDWYAKAWLTGSTLGEELDTSETGLDVASNSLFAVGNLVRIDNEINYISALPTGSLTGTRGENGSTAAAHITGTAVKIWQVMEDIRTACLEITQSVNAKRSGQSAAGKITVTGAGVVIRPEDVPPMAQALIETYRKIVFA